MLAGRIKLKTFVAGAAVLGLAGIAGGYAACDKAPSETSAQPVAEPLMASDNHPVEPKAVQPKAVQPRAVQPRVIQPHNGPGPNVKNALKPLTLPSAVDGPSERPVDRAMMSWVGKNLGSKKKKDVTSGSPFKINVYQDAGEATANRAKVDLDRDDKWDEKWTFKVGEISRKVSTADDENYDVEQLWKNGKWTDR